eukprot:TRINITY_DN9292_c0_g1_i3.p1 TRINITY_DN9292_c0_g1~~TRINITY_DN9292_c0_g1_i3.p1  ORF type:complete len:270 (-),score=30.20 TRINITY_DN9292_c0_g1_i3:21-830(-)
MCIRDRYQRRVRGGFFTLDNSKLIMTETKGFKNKARGPEQSIQTLKDVFGNKIKDEELSKTLKQNNGDVQRTIEVLLSPDLSRASFPPSSPRRESRLSKFKQSLRRAFLTTDYRGSSYSRKDPIMSISISSANPPSHRFNNGSISGEVSNDGIYEYGSSHNRRDSYRSVLEQKRGTISTPLASPVAKGLANAPGENNCFLNVVIQSLWHIRSFSKQFLACEQHVHSNVQNCTFCALKSILNEYVYSDGNVITPAILRKSLSAMLSLIHI